MDNAVIVLPVVSVPILFKYSCIQVQWQALISFWQKNINLGFYNKYCEVQKQSLTILMKPLTAVVEIWLIHV